MAAAALQATAALTANSGMSSTRVAAFLPRCSAWAPALRVVALVKLRLKQIHLTYAARKRSQVMAGPDTMWILVPVVSRQGYTLLQRDQKVIGEVLAAKTDTRPQSRVT